MKISLGNLVLCAGFGRHEPQVSLTAPGRLLGRLDIGRPQVAIQRAELLRAAAAVYFPRGNASQTVTFKVVRQFQDFKTAVAFRGAHAGLLGLGSTALQGTWKIQPEWAGDGIAETLYHPGAVLVSVHPPVGEPANAGLSVVMEYMLEGALLTTVKQ